jgi:hypothetical protein
LVPGEKGKKGRKDDHDTSTKAPPLSSIVLVIVLVLVLDLQWRQAKKGRKDDHDHEHELGGSPFHRPWRRWMAIA